MSEISNDQYLIVCANILLLGSKGSADCFLMMEGFSPSKQQQHPQDLLCTWPCTLKKLDEESQNMPVWGSAK
jgi:hypothetical protein